MHLPVGDIRIREVDKETGKIRCGCDIVCNDEVDSVSFAAQYNQDGELYVEVIGLGDD